VTSSPRRRRPSLPEAGAAAALFVLCFAALQTWFWRHGRIVDTPGYHDYARAVLDHGLVPYRDFAVEYPPLSLPVFVLPGLVPNYDAAFAGLMAVCGVGAALAVLAVDRRAGFYAALAPVLAGSLVLSRFDLWPALLVAVALLLLVEERDAAGWAFLGAGVAAKLWPLTLVPLALLWSLRRGRTRAPLAGAAVVAAAFLPFVVLAPHGIWSSVYGQVSRPLQIESLAASLLTTFGHPTIVEAQSLNVQGHERLGAAFSVIQLLAVAAVWAEFARGPATRARLLTYSAAAVCAFVAFGKVLSPQYLLWLIPLVPLAAGRRRAPAVALLTLACVLTQIWFPLRYWSYVYTFHLAGVVLARNLVLVALYALLAWPTARARGAPRS